MFIANRDKGKLYSLQTKEVSGLFSPLAEKILYILAQRPTYPKEIASRLRVHEQKVYYHIRVLEKSGLIKVIRKEERGGSLAKFYTVTKPSFFIRFRDFDKTEKIPSTTNKFLEPFIVDSKMNAKIVVGSPDPHGPERARSRDAYYAIDLATFLGTFLTSSSPSVMLDTDMRSSDAMDNLILIGGPVINRITKSINDKLPIRFDKKKNIYSSLTKKTYKSDDHGIIVKIRNPLSPDKYILLIAGKRYSGTRASILAFLQSFDRISEGNMKRKNVNAKVVKGIDDDGDGIVDKVKILE